MRRAQTSPSPAAGPVKVYILIMDAYGMGGTIRTVLNTGGHLAREHDVEVISIIRRSARPSFAFSPGLRVRVLDDRTVPYFSGGLKAGVRVAMSGHVSLLVHEEDHSFGSSSLWTDLLLARAFRSMGEGVVVTTRPALNLLAAQLAPGRLKTVGQEHMHSGAHRPALAADIRRLYDRLDALAVLTRADGRDYARMFPSSRPRVVQIPNALPEMSGGVADPRAKVVIAAGRLIRQKGFDRLIPAFAHVVAADPEWTLRIFGSGAKEEELRQRVAECGLHDHVQFMGSTEHLGEELAKASIFALSSRFEGFAMVIVEAMSKGLPVVSFDCPHGPAEILTHGREGLLVPNGDVRAFGESLLALAGDEEERRRMGIAGLKRSEDYDIEVIGRQWTELVKSLSSTVAR